MGREAPAPVLVPLGPWHYLGPTGWMAGNGSPLPNPPPRPPLPSLAPTGRMGGPGWTARRELCHAAFSRWLQWYLDTPAVEASFAWADAVHDDI